MQHIIDRYRIKAKKSLGQNFLMNQNILNAIGEITSMQGENIIEVGPGFGALTEIILQKHPKSLTLVELDDFMVEILTDRQQRKELPTENIDFFLYHGDVLKFTPSFGTYKVIANIPYYITSPILHRFLYEVDQKPSHMIILMQKEVAERIVNKKSSVLSLFVNKKCFVSEQIFVPRSDFSPPPKVDSSVVYFEIHNEYDSVDDTVFLKFIKSAFLNPRKKMVNNLSLSGYNKQEILQKLQVLGFGENTRAEELSIQDFIYLMNGKI